MYMKANNAGKNMGLRAETANQKLKKSELTYYADGMQSFFCVFFMTLLEAIFQLQYY